MLTSAEVSVIKAKALSVFIAEAKLDYTREELGIPTTGSNALEAMLYQYALSLYEYNSSLNYLTECQVTTIYSRLRELRDA